MQFQGVSDYVLKESQWISLVAVNFIDFKKLIKQFWLPVTAPEKIHFFQSESINTFHTAPDKKGYLINMFLISPWKHILWTLIRSFSARRFSWVPQKIFFCGEIRKISIHSFWMNTALLVSIWNFAFLFLHENIFLCMHQHCLSEAIIMFLTKTISWNKNKHSFRYGPIQITLFLFVHKTYVVGMH